MAELRFSLQEIGAYMAAEGVYSENAFVQDVHMRIRVPDPTRPSRLQPPTSSVSFWQIERDNPSDGRPIRWSVNETKKKKKR